MYRNKKGKLTKSVISSDTVLILNIEVKKKDTSHVSEKKESKYKKERKKER